jgi:hypothetical protein
VQTEAPLIVIASASSYERHRLGLALKKTRWRLCEAESADEARAGAGGGAAILVIDAGALESAHDAQWRTLRSRNPHWSAIVRSLIPRGEMLRTDARTCLVHPDDIDSLCEAIAVLSRE